MAKMSIVIDGEDGLCLHCVPGEEAVVQAVLFCANNLQVEDKIALSTISASHFTHLKCNYSHELYSASVDLWPPGGGGNRTKTTDTLFTFGVDMVTLFAKSKMSRDSKANMQQFKVIYPSIFKSKNHIFLLTEFCSLKQLLNT